MTDTDHVARAQKALRAFRAMQPGLTAYARAVTGRPRLRVEATADAPHTDGADIYFRPPIALADDLKHDRKLCDKRDPDTLAQLCAACAVREEVLVTMYHEIAHVAYNSFQPFTDHDRKQALIRGITLKGDAYGKAMNARLDRMAHTTLGNTFMGLAETVSEFLPDLVNITEDIRIDEKMYAARKGIRRMREGRARRAFTHGIEGADGVMRFWKDTPLNSQFVVAMYAKAAGFEMEGHFHQRILDAWSDSRLTALANAAKVARSASDAFNIAFDVLVEGKKLGFFEEDTDPEPEPQPEPQDQESDEKQERSESGPDNEPDEPEQSSEPEAGEPDDNQDEQDTDPASGEATDTGGSDSGDPLEESSEPMEDSPPETDDDSAGESGGKGDEDQDTETPAEGDAPDPDGSEAPSERGEDGDTEPADDGQGDSGSEPEDSQGDGGSSSDEDSESGSDQDAGGSEPGDGESDQLDSDELSSGDSQSGDDRGDGSSGTPSEGDVDDSPEGSSGGDDPQDSDDTDSSNGDDQGDPQDGAGQPESGGGDDSSGEADEADRGDLGGSEGTPEEVDAEGASEPDSPDPATDHGDSEPLDTGEYDPDGAYEDDSPAMGGAGDIGEVVEAVTGHHGDHEAETYETGDNKAMAKAILAGAYFEKPPQNVSAVRVHRWDQLSVDYEDAWRGQNGGFIKAPPGYRLTSYPLRALRQVGIGYDLTVDESVLGPALLQTRRAFNENARAKHMRNLKSGRVSGPSLAKRAPFNDPRMFKKTVLPGKRSYSVLIGIDISGSTRGRNVVLAKRAAKAQAELCSRVGVDFAVYAHTAEPEDSGDLSLEIYEIKNFREQWHDQAKEALDNIGSYSQNLDGHTIEYYRKLIEREQTTDKIILYYTDGKMPAANFKEELNVLQDQILHCKRQGIELMGVGIRTDSPIRHGLDTVRVDTDSDLVKVVEHLEKKLLNR